MNIKRLFLALGLLCLCAQLQAKLSLPEIIGDNMVLQQQSNARIWGWSNPGARVSIRPSWSSRAVQVKADASGKWIAALPTPKASYTQHSIVIESAGEKISLHNVLIGEVWFASGQSNMEMPLNGFWNCPVEGANEVLASAGKWKGVRMVTIPKTGSLKPEERVEGKWQEPLPQNVRWWSATSTFFAHKLNEVLDIPVGVIVCSWGGSRVESWLPEEIVRGYEDIDFETESTKMEQTWWHYSDVTIMYNAMYHPIKDYTVKGFLWYQGESNVGKEDSYSERFQTLCQLWRADQGFEAPVFWVELCPWFYGGDGTSGARFREMQHGLEKKIANGKMICTNDLVYPDEDIQIHPRNKRGVGERLAYAALCKTYSMDALRCDCPCFKELIINGKMLEIYLDNAEDGLYPWKGLEGFEVAGPDRVFHPAYAWLDTDRKCILVSCPDVQWPQAVRYCFRDFQLGNVRNVHGLPLIPFRSDDWPALR